MLSLSSISRFLFCASDLYRSGKVVFVAGVTGSLAACEMFVDVEVPEEPPRLVVNHVMGVDEPFAGFIRLTEDQSVLNPADFEVVSGATVTLREAGACTMLPEEGADCMITLEENKSIPRNYSAQIRPSAGQTYTLQIEKEGFDPVEATTTIPYPVEIKSIAYDTISLPPTGSSARNTQISEIRLTFDDPAGEYNYYELEVEGQKAKVECDSVGSCDFSPTNSSRVYMWMNSSDPAIVNSNYGLQSGGSRVYGEILPFNDELFDGQTYTLRFDPNAYFYGDSLRRTLTIRLKSVTEEQYEYTYAKWLQRTARENRYAEPVPVPNNIKNGYGLFAGYSVDITHIRLP